MARITTIDGHRAVVIGLATIVATSTILLGVGPFPPAIGLASAEVHCDWEDGDCSSFENTGNKTRTNETVGQGHWSLNVSDDDSGVKFPMSKSTPDNATQLVRFPSFGGSGTDYNAVLALQHDSSGDDGPVIQVNGNGVVVFQDKSGGRTNTGIQLNASKWYEIRATNIDYANETYDIEVYDMDSNLVGEYIEASFRDVFDASGFTENQVSVNSAQPYIHFDYFATDEPQGEFHLAAVRGQVTDRDDEAIANVTVEAKQNGTVQESTLTNETGHYKINLYDGDYNLTASKENYTPETHAITVNGSDVNQDFTLAHKDRNITIDTRNFLRHGQTQPYTIYYWERDNETYELERFDVTNNSTVTSNNTNALTVDEVNHELVATENESINVKVLVTAEYTRDNNTYTAEENVTVATLTLDNIKILPGAYRLNATFSSPPDSDSNPMLVIIIATLVGVVGARASTSFGGLSLMTMAVMVAWFGGFISHGMMLVTVVTATFIGLNVAGNINYSVHR